MLATPTNDLGLTEKKAAVADGGGCCGGGDCACSSGTSSTESATITESTAETAISADYLVSGMTCGHCVSSVTEELSGLDGVHQIAVDLDPTGTSTVTVSSAAPLDLDDVRTAIAEAGYILVDVAR